MNNKTIASAFALTFSAMMSGCTTLDETGKLETLCGSVSQNEICAELNTQDLTCLESRTALVLHRIEEYQQGESSVQSPESEIPFLASHRACLEQQFDDMPIFKTAQRNDIKEELIRTKENINKIKDELEVARMLNPNKKRIILG